MATKKRLTPKNSSSIIKPQAKKKPQLIINTMSLKSKVTIYVSGGKVEDIVKENCPDLDIKVHDYDIGDIEDGLFKDDKGKSFICFEF